MQFIVVNSVTQNQRKPEKKEIQDYRGKMQFTAVNSFTQNQIGR